jgi:dolichol kinase
VEAHAFTGATYVTLANLLAILLFEKEIAVTVLLFLSISDALASLVGIRFGRTRFFGKSLAGSVTFFISAVAIALWMLPAAWLTAPVGALVATVVEAVPIRVGKCRLDDNLLIPLVAGAAMTALRAVLG